jgi:NAD(P)-dependent dehydrogenase (short-subunit alcohol dehydrogenase family)
VPTDVSNADQVEAAAQAVEDRFGPIDVWINNAMVSVFSPVRDTTGDHGAHGMFDALAHGQPSILADYAPSRVGGSRVRARRVPRGGDSQLAPPLTVWATPWPFERRACEWLP